MSTVRLLVILLLVCCSTQKTSLAEGWSWPNLNPFSNDGGKTVSKRTSWLGGKPLRSSSAKKSQPAKPGVIKRMGTGTKKLWNRTVDALSWEEEKEARGSHTSWNDPSPYRRSSNKKSDEASWWTNWWRREEPRPSDSIQDFLSQERPEQAYE